MKKALSLLGSRCELFCRFAFHRSLVSPSSGKDGLRLCTRCAAVTQKNEGSGPKSIPLVHRDPPIQDSRTCAGLFIPAGLHTYRSDVSTIIQMPNLLVIRQNHASGECLFGVMRHVSTLIPCDSADSEKQASARLDRVTSSEGKLQRGPSPLWPD
jgi:hypothetical protein